MAIGAAYGSLTRDTTLNNPGTDVLCVTRVYFARVPSLRSPKMVFERVDDVDRPGRFRVARTISGCEIHADDAYYAFIQVIESYIPRK